MQNITRLKRLLVIFALVVVALIGWSIYQSETFHIVNEQPALDSVNAVTLSLDINFNQDLLSKYSISSLPQVIKSSSIHGKTLTLNFNVPMSTKEQYTIKLNKIISKSGSVINNQSLVFTPKDVNSQSLTGSQLKAELKTQSEPNAIIAKYPLLAHLPFFGPGLEYSIDYELHETSSGEAPIIQITAPTQQYYQAAISWITSQGYNTSQMDIQYIDAQPT